MNATQLALRTAAHARDYDAINHLFAAGATAGDLLHSVLHDIARTGDAVLFEILLCSAPADFDFLPARAIERSVRSGAAGLDDGETIAMHIRAALWRKLLVDEMLEDQRHLQLALDSSAAIVRLAGFEKSEQSKELDQRILTGEISFDEAVQVVLDMATASQ